MIKTYSYSKDKNTYLSTHFQVKEFASFGNGKLYSDSVLIDTELISKLENVFSKVKASKCVISSGYRTVQCDKAVGGTGVGQHVNGRAADCCFYDKSGKIIPSKIVVCVAWDLGQLKGIAKIDNNYVHLDNRTTGTYYGDEQRGYSSYWTNPYQYFNVSLTEVSYYTNTITSGSIKYQSHGLNKKWYSNVYKGTNDYAGVIGISMDGIKIDVVKYRVKVNSKWLPEVNGRDDYAGIIGHPITDIAIKNCVYRVHIKGGSWLPWVNGYNINDSNNGYAGNGKVIDAIQIK